AHIALPVNRLRYAWHGAGSSQGAASRRRPLYPRAPASKIAATRWERLSDFEAVSTGSFSNNGE
ncbi:hypothetical protein, partial [Klebsiella pneumoniae]|uniref:hypothetical protein n=1 Tax=Klebsiella pneumoniae TaxID=573 RepID=UPI001F4AEB20